MTDTENLEGEEDFPRSRMNSLIRWRRQTVWELRSSGLSVDQIVDTLKPKDGIKISHATVCRDLRAKEKEIEDEFSEYLQNLPARVNLGITRIQWVIREACRQYANDQNKGKEMFPIILRATEVEQELLEKPVMIQKAIETAARLAQALKASERQTQEVLSN